MKLQIYFYHGKNEKLEEQTGYKHLQEYASLTFSMISIIMEDLFVNGLNVMLCHNADGSAVLYIDNERFKQR